MHFFRCAPLLVVLSFIFTLSNGQDDYDEDYHEEHFWMVTTTTISSREDSLNYPGYPIDDTSMESTTESNEVDYLDELVKHEDDTELQSSTSTVTTTTSYELPLNTYSFSTNWIMSYSTTETNHVDPYDLHSTEINRTRLRLRIFAIVVIVCMFGLAVLLMTIHLIRRKRRYGDYRSPPPLPSSSAQLKTVRHNQA